MPKARATLNAGTQRTLTDAAATTALQDAQEELSDLLLEVLPPDGSTMGNLSAREALGQAAERQIGEEEYEAVKGKALTLGLVVKGRGRGGSIALAEGVPGGSRYSAPAEKPTQHTARSGAWLSGKTPRDGQTAFSQASSLNRLHLQIIFYGREHCTARGCDSTVCSLCRELYPTRRRPVIWRKA